MDADFLPQHIVHVVFDQLLLPGGMRLPIHTVISPGAGVLQFVPAKQINESKLSQGKAAAKGKVSEAKEQIKQQIATLKKQVMGPDKVHRLERLALSQSPYRPQYLDSGTSFTADVQQMLPFGSEQLKPGMVSDIGTIPPSGGVVHAWLTTPLDSATSKKGDP